MSGTMWAAIIFCSVVAAAAVLYFAWPDITRRKDNSGDETGE